MRKLMLILMAMIAVVNFIRAYEDSQGQSQNLSAASMESALGR
jgi:hypothetical protein